MPDFKIVFSGLMCHVRINDRTRAAAIISDRDHTPRIWISPSGTKSNHGFEETERVHEWRTFVIPSNARIHFKGLETGKVSAPDDLAVPHMKELIPHFAPATEILQTQQHAWVRGYVVYSVGTFSIPCYHKEAAHFEGSDQEQFACRAQELMLTAISEEDQDVEITDAVSGRSLMISNTATIGFTQIDKTDHSGQQPKDHQLYKNIAKENVAVLQIQKMKCEKDWGTCVLPIDYDLLSVTVECMSTQWP